MSKALDLIARLQQQVAAGDLGRAVQGDAPVQHHVSVKRVSEGTEYSWDKETKKRCSWLEAFSPDGESAVLVNNESGRAAVVAVDLATFVKALRIDVAEGPAGPRSRTGALQADLAILYGCYNRSTE